MNQGIGKNRLYRGLLAVALPALLAACHSTSHQMAASSQGHYCSGNVYLMRYNCSIDRIQQAAESGVPDAQYALGYMYYYGIDTVRDQRTAEMWIQKAAAKGQPLAKRAWRLIQSDADFSDLHQAAGGNQYRSSGSSSSYQPREDVAQMNQRTPENPISNHLPGYKKVPTKEVKPNTGSEMPKIAPPPLTQSTSKRQVAKNRVPEDPRLKKNAKPMSPVAMKPAKDQTIAKQQASTALRQGDPNALNPKHFTLQLMGSYDLSMLKGFVSRYNIGDKANYFATRMHDKAWYVLVYGDYRTQHSAIQALHKLPRTLRASKPWVKSTQSLIKEVQLQRIVS